MRPILHTSNSKFTLSLVLLCSSKFIELLCSSKFNNMFFDCSKFKFMVQSSKFIVLVCSSKFNNMFFDCFNIAESLPYDLTGSNSSQRVECALIHKNTSKSQKYEQNTSIFPQILVYTSKLV